MHNLRSKSETHSGSTGHRCRRGISLFEVVLALAIFLAAFMALSQLASTGMSAAVQARLQTKAILRCESKLAELTSAVEPLNDVTDQPFADDPTWTWSLVTSPGPHADLLLLTVSVRYESDSDMANAGFALTQLIRDPVLFEPPPAEDAEDEV